MISYLTAIEKIFSVLPARQEQNRKLSEANGYFLAEEVVSPTDLPPFNNSAMDGYALKSAYTVNASAALPVILRIIGESLAGRQFEKRVGQGQCAYITTGAPIPEAADAIIPVEEIEKISENEIAVNSAVKKSNHIRFAGEEIQKGDLVFKAGTQLSPAHLGILATFGMTNPLVYRKPGIGFIATGDELINPDGIPEPGQIRNSNTSIIRAQVEELGCPFIDLGIAGDNRKDLLGIVKRDPLPDILITSAGVSMGEYDLVTKTLEQVGLQVFFWKVAIKPGKPLVFGRIGETLFFGLPGNPVSSALVFRQFIEPVILAISGSKKPFREIVHAVAADNFKVTKNRLHFARGIASYSDKLLVKSAGKQGSHMLSSLAKSNCLVLIPPDVEIKEGDKVLVQLLDGPLVDFDYIRETLS